MVKYCHARQIKCKNIVYKRDKEYLLWGKISQIHICICCSHFLAQNMGQNMSKGGHDCFVLQIQRISSTDGDEIYGDDRSQDKNQKAESTA